jgi:hypothetical protein
MDDKTKAPRVSDKWLNDVLIHTGLARQHNEVVALESDELTAVALDLRDARATIRAQAEQLAAKELMINLLKIDVAKLEKAIEQRDAAEAELARIKSAEGCDVEGALDAYMDAPNKGLPYDSLVQQRMSAALAAGCVPLRAKLALYETALRKIACWHVVAPEVNYPHYASMAVVTAREIVPQKEPTDGNP